MVVMPARELRRHVALLTSWIFIACTLLGLQHDADVALVYGTFGEVAHAPHIGCSDRKAPTHVHSLPSDEDDDNDDACELTAAAYPLEPTPEAPHTVVAPWTPTAAPVTPAVSADPPAPLLRLAPKTSPPRAA
jgi:hypothetical protein